MKLQDVPQPKVQPRLERNGVLTCNVSFADTKGQMLLYCPQPIKLADLNI